MVGLETGQAMMRSFLLLLAVVPLFAADSGREVAITIDDLPRGAATPAVKVRHCSG